MKIDNVLEFIDGCSHLEFEKIASAVERRGIPYSSDIDAPKKSMADAEKEKILIKLYNRLDYKELLKIEEIYLT